MSKRKRLFEYEGEMCNWRGFHDTEPYITNQIRLIPDGATSPNEVVDLDDALADLVGPTKRVRIRVEVIGDE